MKYNRFIAFKKLTSKVSAGRIEIPLRYAVVIGIFSIISTGTALISPYLYKMLVDNVMTEGELNLLIQQIPYKIVRYTLVEANIFFNTCIKNDDLLAYNPNVIAN